MIITLKDGSTLEYAEAMSAYDIARDISDGLARAACLAEIDGEVCDLRTIVDKDCELNILTFGTWAKSSRVREPRRTALPRGSQARVLW